MSQASRPAQHSDELDDDDAKTIRRMTGALHSGNPAGIREEHGGDYRPRRCPPKMKRDPEATARFNKAWDEHEEKDKVLEEVTARMSMGEISEEQLIARLNALSLSKKRPAVALGACRLLAQIKGLLDTDKKGDDEGTDRVATLVEGLAERRSALAQERIEDIADEEGAA